ncbi:hypothetical protein BGZ52_007141 [Haplosporangium bisporale]|nr:hypothetical protein BGZ52_007141 [Haplosporangium bisporale]KAF9208049.1 hypothetical protein BGZ59_010820 [Podila verticillata]
MTVSTRLSIAIIGAGLGGLATARTLQQRSIAVTVFELETAFSSRNQGGTLDVHPESGQHALRTNGLWPAIVDKVRYEGQDLVIADKNGKVWMEEKNHAPPSTEGDNGEGPAPGFDRPEVDRGVLRQVYLDSLEEDTIRWGVKVAEILPADPATPGSKHTLVLDNGTRESYDVVIGADGAWSRVRSLLSPAKPVYSGVTMFETHLYNVDRDHPKASQTIGHGSVYVLSDNKGLGAQRNGDGSIRTYVMLRIPEADVPKFSAASVEDNRAYILQQFPEWLDKYTDLVRYGKEMIPRPIYALDPAHQWRTVRGITLLGDAAHVMSPFAGEGANLALLDGLELGQALVKVVEEGQDLLAVQETFEKTMLARSRISAEVSAANIEKFLHVNAPEITVEALKKLMAGPPGEQ